MKKTFLFLSLGMLAIACSGDDATTIKDSAQNKVVLLQVDYLTGAFEGGKELIFPEAEDFTLTYDYTSPGDFGDITLNYEEVNQPLFAGTIVWDGKGEREFPEAIDAVSAFATINTNIALPANDTFEQVNYNEDAYPENMSYQPLWEAVDNLQVVKEYRESNPAAKIHVFLYAPSVGVGNPAEWDYYLILKN